jgi:hypothetical protein
MLKLAKGYKSIEAVILSFKPKTAAPHAPEPEAAAAFDIIPNATEDEIRASLQAEAERKAEANAE